VEFRNNNLYIYIILGSILYYLIGLHFIHILFSLCILVFMDLWRYCGGYFYLWYGIFWIIGIFYWIFTAKGIKIVTGNYLWNILLFGGIILVVLLYYGIWFLVCIFYFSLVEFIWLFIDLGNYIN